MSKKITIGAAIALALIMVAVSIPLTFIFAQNRMNDLVGNLLDRLGQAQALEEIRGVVQVEFYRNFIEEDIIAEMVGGFVAGLGDEHSRYLTAEQWNAFLQRLEGQQPDLGLELRYVPSVDYDPDDEDSHTTTDPGALVIVHVGRDSVAERAGLRSGDRLVRVATLTTVLFEEADLTTYNADEFIQSIVNVGVVQGGDTAEPTVGVDITFVRDDETLSVPVMLGAGISTIADELMQGANGEYTVGYIRVFSFFRQTAEQLDNAMRSLEAAGATSFIIDLRGTYDGTLEFAAEAAHLLLPSSPAGEATATIHFRGGREPQSFVSDAHNIFVLASQGMAILIDENTAGPAELFAFALSFARAESVVLVGRPTRGINTVQQHFPLTHVGGGVILSVGTIVPIGGDPHWNINGVQPTEQIPGVLQYNPYSDIAHLRGAIDYLTRVVEEE